MDRRKLEKLVIAIAAVFIIVSVFFMFSNRINITPKKTRALPEADSVSDEMVNGLVFEQTFENDIDTIYNVAVVFTKFNREAHGTLTFELLEGNTLLFKKTKDVSSIPEQHRVFFTADKPLTDMANKKLTIRLYADSANNDGVGIMIRTKDTSDIIKVGNKTVKAAICFSINESKN